MGGVLYHARYLHLCEDAREKLLRDSGLPYSVLVDEGYHLVIVETSQRFHQPLRYGEKFEAVLWLEDVTRSSLICRYRFVDLNGKLIHSAMTKHVIVEKQGDGFRTTRLPENLKTKLAPFVADAASWTLQERGS